MKQPVPARPLPLNESAGFLTNKAAHALKLGLLRSFKLRGLDVTTEQWGVLNLLFHKDGLTQTELARTAIKDKPNITRILDTMEKKKLVVRQPDPNDGRTFRIHLTGKGRALTPELLECAHATLRQATRGLSPRQLGEYRTALEVIIKNLT